MTLYGKSAASTKVSGFVGIEASGDGNFYGVCSTAPVNAPARAMLNRESADRDYVKKIGDTMTGNLIIKSSSLDISNTPSSQTPSKLLAFSDNNAAYIALIQAMQNADGTNVTALSTRKKIDEAIKTSSLFVNIDKAGVP